MATTEEEPVLVEREGRVMIVTINRPEVRNAVNLAVTRGLGHALDEADADTDVWVVILTGAGEKSFCAGQDLKALMRGEQVFPDDPEEAAWGFAGYVSHHISKPTIAAVNGPALGGGTELTLASDLAVASDTAVFGLPEVKRGVLSGAGGLFRLPKQVPEKIAMEMILTGDPITAQRALELGLVNQVVPQSEVLDAAKALAARITVNAPLSVWGSKRVAKGIVDGRVAAEDAGWEQTNDFAAFIQTTNDSKEGPIAFAQKREPHWTAS